jgi:hypothetical protein
VQSYIPVVHLCSPDSDAEGNGLKPFAINEMSMLAFYHEIEPNELKLLPVVPAHNYILNKYVCNMSMFGPGGPEVCVFPVYNLRFTPGYGV